MPASSATFDDVARPFTVGIQAKAELLRSDRLTKAQRSAVLSSITQDMRKLCDVAVPHLLTPLVSVAAAQKAHALGIDLSRRGWDKQTQFDRDRSTFHLEHCDPVLALRTACLATADVDSMVALLRERMVVAWILKEEDARLTVLGFKTVRRDWRAAYTQAGIQLQYPGSTPTPPEG